MSGAFRSIRPWFLEQPLWFRVWVGCLAAAEIGRLLGHGVRLALEMPTWELAILAFVFMFSAMSLFSVVFYAVAICIFVGAVGAFAVAAEFGERWRHRNDWWDE